MLNLLKENYVVHAIQLWMIICVVTVCYCELFWAHLPHRLSSLTKWSPRVICRTRSATWRMVLYLIIYFSHNWSIVTSGGYAFHNISWRHTATTTGTGLLLARSVAGPKVGDYSWHGTTPGPWHRYFSKMVFVRTLAGAWLKLLPV